MALPACLGPGAFFRLALSKPPGHSPPYLSSRSLDPGESRWPFVCLCPARFNSTSHELRTPARERDHRASSAQPPKASHNSQRGVGPRATAPLTSLSPGILTATWLPRTNYRRRQPCPDLFFFSPWCPPASAAVRHQIQSKTSTLLRDIASRFVTIPRDSHHIPNDLLQNLRPLIRTSSISDISSSTSFRNSIFNSPGFPIQHPRLDSRPAAAIHSVHDCDVASPLHELHLPQWPRPTFWRSQKAG